MEKTIIEIALAALKKAQTELYEQAGEKIGSGRYNYIDEAITKIETAEKK